METIELSLQKFYFLTFYVYVKYIENNLFLNLCIIK